MTAIKHYGTSILGAVVQTIAGLAAIAAFILLVAVGAFLAPGFLGGLGLDVLVSGGTLEENVSHIRADTFLSMPVLVGGFIVSVALFIGGSRAATRLYDLGKIGTERPASSNQSGAGHVDNRSTDEVYLWKFRRSNLWVGIFLALFLLIAVTVRGLAQGSQGGSGMLDLPAGILWFAVRIFGGPIVLAITAAVFLGVWYGLKKSSREVLVVGILVWGYVGLTGLGTISRNGTGIGLVIAGVLGIYYGIRAYSATAPITTWWMNNIESSKTRSPQEPAGRGSQAPETTGGEGETSTAPDSSSRDGNPGSQADSSR